MIWLGFINIAYALIYGITLPIRSADIVSLPSSFTSAISAGSSAVMSFDDIFPVHEIVFIFIAFFLVYEAAYFGLKLINWVIRKIPTIS